MPPHVPRRHGYRSTPQAGPTRCRSTPQAGPDRMPFCAPVRPVRMLLTAPGRPGLDAVRENGPAFPCGPGRPGGGGGSLGGSIPTASLRFRHGYPPFNRPHRERPAVVRPRNFRGKGACFHLLPSAAARSPWAFPDLSNGPFPVRPGDGCATGCGWSSAIPHFPYARGWMPYWMPHGTPHMRPSTPFPIRPGRGVVYGREIAGWSAISDTPGGMDAANRPGR